MLEGIVQKVSGGLEVSRKHRCQAVKLPNCSFGQRGYSPYNWTEAQYGCGQLWTKQCPKSKPWFSSCWLWSILKAIKAADILVILDLKQSFWFDSLILVWFGLLMSRFLVPAHAVYDWSKPHCLLVKSCKSQCLMGKVSLKLRVGKPQTIIFRYPLTVFDIDTPIARAIGALCRRWRRISMSRRGCWSSRWRWLHVGGFKQKVSLLGTNAKWSGAPGAYHLQTGWFLLISFILNQGATKCELWLMSNLGWLKSFTRPPVQLVRIQWQRKILGEKTFPQRGPECLTFVELQINGIIYIYTLIYIYIYIHTYTCIHMYIILWIIAIFLIASYCYDHLFGRISWYGEKPWLINPGSSSSSITSATLRRARAFHQLQPPW